MRLLLSAVFRQVRACGARRHIITDDIFEHAPIGSRNSALILAELGERLGLLEASLASWIAAADPVQVRYQRAAPAQPLPECAAMVDCTVLRIVETGPAFRKPAVDDTGIEVADHAVG